MAQVNPALLRRDPRAAPYRVLRERIVAARKAKGLTQQAVADGLGRPQSFIAKLETGERTVNVIELLAIGRIIDLHITELIAAVEAEL